MLSVMAGLLLALPWLNPFSGGPTPAVLPLLFSWICLLAVFGGGSTMIRVGSPPV